MADIVTLNRPWLVAVWPGMGQVALGAGYYLLTKLEMRQLAEFSAEDLFDVEHIEVKGGLIYSLDQPRSRLFVCSAPKNGHDIILFIGEAQPPAGKYAFCKQLIKMAKGLGVERVFTFAAMATQMHPEQRPRVFGAATDNQNLKELHQLEVSNLNDGQISGLNGVLLAAAMAEGLSGACLLGEIPHLFAHVPFPRAAQTVLEVFTTMARIDLDFSELSEQAQQMERRLGEILGQIERALQQRGQSSEQQEEDVILESPSPTVSEEDRQRIEEMFDVAAEDRSRAYELKRELDQLGIFEEYEDRFLDLFQA